MSFTVSSHAHGTDGWVKDRLGKITASVVDKYVTKTGRPSSQADGAISMSVAEIILGEPVETFQNWAMERGLALEPQALEFFNFTNDYDFKACGFVDSGKGFGCSPDGLDTNARLGLELKCPLVHTHLSYLAGEKLPDNYMMQVQFSMWVTGFDQWVFGSYHPQLPCFSIVVDRDEKLMEAFDKEIPKATKRIEDMVLKIRKKMEVAA